MKEDWQPPSFSDDEWTPELVELCLHNRWLLKVLALWGTASGEWPPCLGTADIGRNYPSDINIMTTRVDFQRAWASLSRRERRLLDLYYLEGQTQEEIGGVLKYSQRHIGRLLVKAQDNIAQFLGCKYE